MLDFAEKIIKNIFSISEVLRNLTVGPLNMASLTGHTLKNLSCLALLTFMLMFSIGGLTGGVELSVFGGSAFSIVTAALVGTVGFIANLTLPVPKDAASNYVERDTNKWVSYSVTAFIFTVLIYIIVQLLFLFFVDPGETFGLVDFLATRPDVSVGSARWLTSLLCGVVGTGLFYTMLIVGGRIKEDKSVAILFYLITALACVLIFHFTHFVFT